MSLLCVLLLCMLIRGSEAQVLYSLESPYPETDGYFGVSVSGAGDVDGNGYEDVVVGAECEDGGAGDAGRTYIFSGQTGSLLHSLQSPNAETNGRFGYSASGVGDVNNAGYDDAVVGALGESGGFPDAGRAHLFAPVDVAVELASFQAKPRAGAVLLTWMTLSERDNFGFDLDRAPIETGPFAGVNDDVIPGAGTTSTPHTYSYLDRTVEPGAVYWYRLEDVSLSGARTSHGPIAAVVPDQPALGLEVLGGSGPAFSLTLTGPGRAALSLYDISGRLMVLLWQGARPDAGTTIVRPEACRTLPPGLYTAVLSQDGATVSRRAAIVR